jgi:hypothetical protein
MILSCHRWPSLACQRNDKSEAGRTVVHACWRNGESAVGYEGALALLAVPC